MHDRERVDQPLFHAQIAWETYKQHRTNANFYHFLARKAQVAAKDLAEESLLYQEAGKHDRAEHFTDLAQDAMHLSYLYQKMEDEHRGTHVKHFPEGMHYVDDLGADQFNYEHAATGYWHTVMLHPYVAKHLEPLRKAENKRQRAETRFSSNNPETDVLHEDLNAQHDAYTEADQAYLEAVEYVLRKAENL